MWQWASSIPLAPLVRYISLARCVAVGKLCGSGQAVGVWASFGIRPRCWRRCPSGPPHKWQLGTLSLGPSAQRAIKFCLTLLQTLPMHPILTGNCCAEFRCSSQFPNRNQPQSPKCATNHHHPFPFFDIYAPQKQHLREQSRRPIWTPEFPNFLTIPGDTS